MIPKQYSSELYHYGVLGMKWGIHRGRTEQAYTKASKKLSKLDKKVDKAEAKARKRKGQADTTAASILGTRRRVEKAEAKAKKASAKAAIRLRKAERWYKSMEKNFANTDIKISQEQIAMGQRYMDRLDLRTFTY